MLRLKYSDQAYWTRAKSVSGRPIQKPFKTSKSQVVADKTVSERPIPRVSSGIVDGLDYAQ